MMEPLKWYPTPSPDGDGTVYCMMAKPGVRAIVMEHDGWYWWVALTVSDKRTGRARTLTWAQQEALWEAVRHG
jgi:hypothetical protein